MTFPLIERPAVTPSTIVPVDESLFIPYFNDRWEELSSAINAKDYSFFAMPITHTPADIYNLPNFGAFIICVSGSSPVTNPSTGIVNYLPTITASLVKSSASAAGTVNVIGSQAGTGDTWLASTLTITSTATNFQIKHSVSGVTGNFNIRIIGTQG